MNPTQTHAVRPQNPGKSLTIASWILQILAAAAFFAAGGAKLTGAPAMVAVFDKIGVGQWFLYLTGVLEVVGAIGLLIPRTALYAAVLLACVMVGAILAHITVLGGSFVAPLVLLMMVLAIAWVRRPLTR